MGVYISEVTFADWSGPLLRLGSALDFALAGQDLPLYMPEPRLADQIFEEKLIPPMDDFGDLCAQELRGDLCSCLDWDLLVPVDFGGAIELPTPSHYSDTTTVRSGHRLLEAMRAMARRVGLPGNVPADPKGMALTTWFTTATQPNGEASRWRAAPAVIFYTALFLRAAERATEHHCALHVT